MSLPPSQLDDPPSTNTAPWRSVLLIIVMGLIWFLTFGGFVLFFSGTLLPKQSAVAESHFLFGIGFMLLYAFYQIRHYRAVARYKKQLHYKLGLALLVTVVLTSLSGIALRSFAQGLRAVDLLHVMAGFALLIFLISHLTLVFRIYLQRIPASKTSGALNVFWSSLGLWLPPLLGLVAVAVTLL